MRMRWEKPSMSFSPGVYSGRSSTVPAVSLKAGWMGVSSWFVKGERMWPMILYAISMVEWFLV